MKDHHRAATDPYCDIQQFKENWGGESAFPGGHSTIEL